MTKISKITGQFEAKQLEWDYRRYASTLETGKDRLIMYIGVILYLAYSLLDWVILQENAQTAIMIRLVCGLAAVCIMMASQRILGDRHFQLISTTILFVGGVSVCFMIWNEGALQVPYYVGLIQITLLLTCLIRTSFPLSLVMLAILYGVYNLSTWGFPRDVAYVSSHFFLVNIFMCCLAANLLMEINRRKEFLQHQAKVQLTEQLQEMIDDANISLTRKNAILKILTHVLKTPLHQIIGYSQILEQEPLGKHSNPTYQEFSTNIHEAGQNMLRVLRRLMQYSRLDSGTATLSLTPLSAKELFDCALSRLEEDIEKKNIVLGIAHNDIMFNIDGTLMESALYEIAKNAIDASCPQGKVTVSASRVGQNYQIIVADEGSGIPKDQLQNINDTMELTEDFLQVSETISLGVTLAHKVLHLHGGDVHIASTVDKGTVVTMIFSANLEAPNDDSKSVTAIDEKLEDAA